MLNNVSAIILAAGSGKRIGAPKLKLKIGENYFVNLIVSKLKSAGIEEIVCVIRKEDKEWFEENVSDIQFIENNNTESGMISSIYLGVSHRKNSSGIMVFPVDHPLIDSETIAKLIKSFKENCSSVVKPSFKGQSGHPIIIPNQLYKEVLKKRDNEHLNNIIIDSKLRVIQVEVEDEGILKNINYKTDLDIV